MPGVALGAGVATCGPRRARCSGRLGSVALAGCDATPTGTVARPRARAHRLGAAGSKRGPCATLAGGRGSVGWLCLSGRGVVGAGAYRP